MDLNIDRPTRSPETPDVPLKMTDQEKDTESPPPPVAKNGLGGTRYGPIWQVMLAIFPILLLQIYFIGATYVIQRNPCDVDEENEETVTTCYDQRRLITMVTVCLIFALCWLILAVYLTLYVQRRHELLRQYLTVGRRAVGDVYYEDEGSCGTISKEHWGYLTYPHVNYGVYPVYVRRRVRVLQYYTREKVSISVLPNKPFSGLPREDVMLDLSIAEKNRPKRAALAVVSWVCFVLAALIPIYMLFVLEQIKEAAGVEGDALWVSWLIYALIISIIIPGISYAINEYTWRRHYYQITEKGKIAEEGEDDDVDVGVIAGPTGTWQSGSRSDAEIENRKYVPPGIVTKNSSSSSFDDGTMIAASSVYTN